MRNNLSLQLGEVDQQLSSIIDSNIDKGESTWLDERIESIIGHRSTRDLYLTYSLIPSKIDLKENLNIPFIDSDLGNYIHLQRANNQEVARIYLLVKVLNADSEFFTEKVANIIQVADTGELETFLKFLILLPNPESYKTTAVAALRTNISTVFYAIAHNNPYPSLFFDEPQWNQMYLKCAFMEGDLSAILNIDARANKDLVRIISDYAHERWAASREIDPVFWRPVARLLDDVLLKDMERLLKSDNPIENRAGALCCHASGHQKAKALLAKYPVLQKQMENQEISWESLKD